MGTVGRIGVITPIITPFGFDGERTKEMRQRLLSARMLFVARGNAAAGVPEIGLYPSRP